MSSLLRAVAETRDRVAFEALFRYFAPRIKAYMLRHGASASLAEDLAQEALLIAWRKAHLYDPAKGSAASWMFTIARNLHIDAVRHQRRPEFDPNDPAFVPDPEPQADAAMERGDDDQRLRKALENLSPAQRNVLELSYFAEKPHAAIARELRLPLGTVKSRLRMAIKRVRKSLLK
ncbi:MAG: sigma-70 family RNA polymerase sigma factor [Alphaproteobacteria bacterium]|nr:sigma-70 family RNA polymerase sigma factor [Alphaproteobacteria bacterium]